MAFLKWVFNPATVLRGSLAQERQLLPLGLHILGLTLKVSLRALRPPPASLPHLHPPPCTSVLSLLLWVCPSHFQQPTLKIVGLTEAEERPAGAQLRPHCSVLYFPLAPQVSLLTPDRLAAHLQLEACKDLSSQGGPHLGGITVL